MIVLYDCFVFEWDDFLTKVCLFLLIAFRDLPLSILIGIPLVTCCYVLVNIAYLAVLTPAEIKLSTAVAVVSTSNLRPQHFPFTLNKKDWYPRHPDLILLAAVEDKPKGGIELISSQKTKIRSETCFSSYDDRPWELGCQQAIGHFRVAFCLYVKTSLSTKPFTWKWLPRLSWFWYESNSFS